MNCCISSLFCGRNTNRRNSCNTPRMKYVDAGGRSSCACECQSNCCCGCPYSCRNARV